MAGLIFKAYIIDKSEQYAETTLGYKGIIKQILSIKQT